MGRFSPPANLGPNVRKVAAGQRQQLAHLAPNRVTGIELHRRSGTGCELHDRLIVAFQSHWRELTHVLHRRYAKRQAADSTVDEG